MVELENIVAAIAVEVTHGALHAVGLAEIRGL